jgi:hypothetical protein
VDEWPVLPWSALDTSLQGLSHLFHLQLKCQHTDQVSGVASVARQKS